MEKLAVSIMPLTNLSKTHLNSSTLGIEDSFLHLETVTKGSILISLTSSIIQYLSMGLVIGLYDQPIALTGFAIALSCQEISETVTLGYSLNKLRLKSLKVVFFILSFFSLLTPVGILLGNWIDSKLGYSKSFLIGFSAGNFIYVGSCVVIGNEFSDHQKNDRFFKFYALGIVGIVLLWVVAHSSQINFF
jgi:hypothetical protein